ncbi:Innexin [Fasciolopsis buskii]|uniref:Innexin n=1 Tax=Fasciolopsis buskii TaxID=27845 RepID=A0A8E0RQ58_9TREM|nr:Innexin [Fasciolopsis buski]
MSAPNFINLYNKYRLASFIGVDDWADRLSYFYSFVIYLTCTMLVTSKTYLFRPIACHMPTAPEGANFKNYVESACWVLGTVPIRSNESMPQQPQSWEELEKSRRLSEFIEFYLGFLMWLFNFRQQ